ncbi:MAG: Nif3-like dinuclear metal center hexameric protein [Oscillospiraceae bacterium]|nr:Nif3-like dinuclear metal center hexameric protein [Oscillospiraceae bacterium]
MKFGDLTEYLGNEFPKNLSASWDNDGVEACADYNLEIGRILTVVDITFDVIDYAVTNGYNCIISHHPMIFTPLKKLDLSNPAARKAAILLSHNICAASYHTRLDAASGGVNDCLLEILNIAPDSIELLYDPEDNIPVGRIAELEAEQNIGDFIEDIRRSFRKFYKKEFLFDMDLNISCLKGGKNVKKFAVVSGSGMDYAGIAAKMGSDTFFTGEGSYHKILDAYEELDANKRLNIVTAGHFETEAVVLPHIRHKILDKFPNAAVNCFIGDNVGI